jgi:SynChlorMet cassette protein ScmD
MKEAIMDNAAKPIANPMVILREEFDDCAILFDPDTVEGYALNPIGVFCWKRLDGKHALADIVTELRAVCDDVPAEAEQDIAALCQELAAKGLVGYEAPQA